MQSVNFALLYSQVPSIACKGLCQQCCGPIMADPAEVEHFESKTGKSFPNPFSVLKSEDLSCPELNSVTGKCNVYQHRPLICRLWGVVDTPMMRCPHGCVPSRWLTDEESRSLLDTANV